MIFFDCFIGHNTRDCVDDLYIRNGVKIYSVAMLTDVTPGAGHYFGAHQIPAMTMNVKSPVSICHQDLSFFIYERLCSTTPVYFIYYISSTKDNILIFMLIILKMQKLNSNKVLPVIPALNQKSNHK